MRALGLERHLESHSSRAYICAHVFGPTVVLADARSARRSWFCLVSPYFLIMVERRRDWVAGASPVADPGEASRRRYLFLLAVALWTIHFRRWTILCSRLCSLTAMLHCNVLQSTCTSSLEFLERTRRVSSAKPYRIQILEECSIVFRITHPLAFLPQIIGLVWLGFYWRKHRFTWDWKSRRMVVLVVSVACSYYSFPYDEILVLPALIVSICEPAIEEYSSRASSQSTSVMPCTFSNLQDISASATCFCGGLQVGG